MNIELLREKVGNRTPRPMDVKGKFSVLIPLILVDDKWHILYELRSKDLKAQPGEISFPGGKVEKGESFKEAAIRETVEELLVNREDIEILGELDFLVSYANFTIHCFLGRINKDIKEIYPSEDEVDHIFTVPIDYFMDNEPKVYELGLITENNDEFPYELIPKGKNYNFRAGRHTVLFYIYKEYVIWGYTARMTRQLIEILKDI